MEEPADGIRVDRENKAPGGSLKAGQRTSQATVVTGSVGGGAHGEALMPGLDGRNAMREHGERGLEGKAVPDVGKKEVLGHGEEAGENVLVRSPGVQ